MKAALCAISVLVVVGLAAGLVFPPGPTGDKPRAASDLVATGSTVSEQLSVQGTPAQSPADPASGDVEVSLGDVAGALGLLAAGVVPAAIWFRSPNPAERVTHRHEGKHRRG